MIQHGTGNTPAFAGTVTLDGTYVSFWNSAIPHQPQNPAIVRDYQKSLEALSLISGSGVRLVTLFLDEETEEQHLSIVKMPENIQEHLFSPLPDSFMCSIFSNGMQTSLHYISQETKGFQCHDILSVYIGKKKNYQPFAEILSQLCKKVTRNEKE